MKLTSILKKTAMAVTGLAWIGFLVGHLAGNLQIFAGSEKFNAYAQFLASLGGLLYVAEVSLIAFLAMHIYSGISVTRENRAARPKDYAARSINGESTLASRSMAVGGVILAVFIVSHVVMFKYGDMTGPGGLWGLVIREFKNPLVVAWYLLAMVALGMHLSHGLQSAFQTLGALKPAWRPKLRQVGGAFGWLIALGFGALPVWAYLYAQI